MHQSFDVSHPIKNTSGTGKHPLPECVFNLNKTYSYKAGLISLPRLQEHTKLVYETVFSQPDKQCAVNSEITYVVFDGNIFSVQNNDF